MTDLFQLVNNVPQAVPEHIESCCRLLWRVSHHGSLPVHFAKRQTSQRYGRRIWNYAIVKDRLCIHGLNNKVALIQLFTGISI
jgi:hypothetical protein